MSQAPDEPPALPAMPAEPGANAPGRYLIVNADDYGQSPGIVAGVTRAHDAGVVTSTSLMVRWSAAEDAAREAAMRPRLSVGLHFDLGEWWYHDGDWLPRYRVTDPTDEGAVAAELERQIAGFRRLMGLDPTHLDSHQHVHRREPARRQLLEAGDRLGVPVRELSGGITYRGNFHGQGEFGESLPELLTVDALTGLLAGIGPGLTELGCHPALVADIESSYAQERVSELETLCSQPARDIIDRAGIELVSFHDLARLKAFGHQPST